VDQVFDTMPPKKGGVGVGTLISAARAAGFSGNVMRQSARETFAHYALTEASNQSVPVVAKREKFPLIFPLEMRGLPEPRYAVETIIPDCAITLIYGAPGSCKSFLILDILASAAAGIPALGKFSTVQGDAVLCAGEAPFGTAKKRWPAFAQARSIADPDNIRFAIVPAVPLVSDPAQIEALIGSIKAANAKPRIVALDTVARASGGLDENDALAAGLVNAAAGRIRDEFNCNVILVHHSGKDETKGARGSSALAAGTDAVFKVKRDKDNGTVVLHCEKMKDADEPEDIHLKEERVRDSLVLNWISKEEYASLTRKNGGPGSSEVGAALRKLGKDVSTRLLAIELAGPDAGEKAIDAMVRQLLREAKNILKAYIVRRGSGGRNGSLWGLRDTAGELGLP
jgi:hypothetical protein